MIALDLRPAKNENWTLERAKVYYLQQIALQLEQFLERTNWLDKYCKKAEEESITKGLALKLMTAKQDIVGLFNGEESMRFSEFSDKLSRIGIYGYGYLQAAINLVDYLDIRKTGNGFRVWLIT